VMRTVPKEVTLHNFALRDTRFIYAHPSRPRKGPSCTSAAVRCTVRFWVRCETTKTTGLNRTRKGTRRRSGLSAESRFRATTGFAVLTWSMRNSLTPMTQGKPISPRLAAKGGWQSDGFRMLGRADETKKMVKYCFAAGTAARGVVYLGTQKVFEHRGSTSQ